MPELVLGVLLVAGFGLATVVWHARASQVTPIAVMARDVTRGATISAADLKAVPIRAEAGVAVVPWSRAASLVGRLAAADLRAGTPLSPGLLTDHPALAAGEALVTVRLAPGAYPDGLAPGDRVDAVLASDPNAVADGAPKAVTLASGAVWAVAPIGESEPAALVTVRLDADGARRLAASASQVRLVRIEG